MEQRQLVIKIDNQLSERIKNIFEQSLKYSKMFLRLLKQNQILVEQIQKIRLQKYPQYKTIKNFIKAICRKQYLISCKVCGKYFQKRRNKKSTNEYCSCQCMYKDKDHFDKIQKTFHNNYSKEQIRNKRKAIWKKKLSNKNQRQKFITSIKKSIKEKYGVQNPYQSQQIKKKIRNTMKQKYGVQYAMKSQYLKKKYLDTITQSGVFYSQQYRKNFTSSMQEKYGVNYSRQSKEILQKIQKNNYQKYGFKSYGTMLAWQNLKKYSNYVIPLFSKQEFKGLDKIYKWKCIKCGNQFQSDLHSSSFLDGLQRLPRCQKCYPKLGGTSNMQKELIEFCKRYFPKLEHNKKRLIKPFQLDIVIHEIKLAMQFNGCYWHSLEAGIPLGYHLTKTEMVQSKGYRLIHIWQDDWLRDKENIKKKLIDVFQNKEVIDYSKTLERDWYPLKQMDGYQIQIIQPKIIVRDGFSCQNTGYLKFKSKKFGLK